MWVTSIIEFGRLERSDKEAEKAEKAEKAGWAELAVEAG